MSLITFGQALARTAITLQTQKRILEDRNRILTNSNNRLTNENLDLTNEIQRLTDLLDNQNKVSGPNCFLKAQISLGNLGFSTFFISMNIKKLYKSTYFNLNNFKIISPNLGQ